VNFLITEFTGLGDFLQKTPIIRAIRNFDSECRIFLIGDNRWGGLDLVRGSSLVDDTCDVSAMLSNSWELKPGLKSLVRRNPVKKYYDKEKIHSWLSQTKFDYVLQSYADDVPSVIGQLFKSFDGGTIVRHIEWREYEKASQWTLVKKLKKNKSREILVPHLRGHHDIDANFDLLQATIDSPVLRQYQCFIAIDSDERAIDRFGLVDTEYVCLQPGAASGLETPKKWETERFVELSTLLYERDGLTPVLIGDRGDLERTIANTYWPNYVVNTAGRTSLGELIALLNGAVSVVAHDSGVMHIANALDIHLVALYGPTDSSRTRPLGRLSRVLFSDTKYKEIMFSSNLSEKKLAEQIPCGAAMEGISVEQVYDTISQNKRK